MRYHVGKDFCHCVDVANRTQADDRSVHGKGMGSVLLLLLLGLSASGCSLFPGDPGPPIAVRGSGSESLGGVLLLMCHGEKVLSLTISENDSAGSGVTPGEVLWEIEASEPSDISEFVPGTDPVGFRTMVAAPPTISGDIVISFETTRGTDTTGTRVRQLPQDVVRFQGREISIDAFYAKSEDVCS